MKSIKHVGSKCRNKYGQVRTSRNYCFTSSALAAALATALALALAIALAIAIALALA